MTYLYIIPLNYGTNNPFLALLRGGFTVQYSRVDMPGYQKLIVWQA